MGRQEWRRIVSWAVRNLDDRIALAESPLGQLRGVVILAEARFGERCWSEGLAVRELLVRAVDTVDRRLKDDSEALQLRTVLRSVLQGETVSEMARQMRVRRETVHRRIWSPVCALVLDEFQRLERETAAEEAAIEEPAQQPEPPTAGATDIVRARPAAVGRSYQPLSATVPSGRKSQARDRSAVHG